MSVRNLVAAIQKEVRDENLQPARASVLLNQLSALIGNINAEIREADMEFNGVYQVCLDTETKANRAKIRAEATPQYLRMREARDTFKLAESMIGALKYHLKTYEAEMRLSR